MPAISIIFATNNTHKIGEIQAAIGNQIEVTGLEQAGIHIDIPEPHETLEANAREKSAIIYKLTGMDCFSEDTGLEVKALGGAPGVRSARYAGKGRSDTDNIDKLLKDLDHVSSREARFRTVISLVWKGAYYSFEGVCEGQITREKRGSAGFGYDPVFLPKGSVRTFGEMTLNEKNQFSHRKKAADQLVLFLQQQS